MSQTPIKRGAKGFNPLKALTWTAETEVQVIKDLVQNKEIAIARHRRLQDASLQNQSEVKVSARFDPVELRNASERYSEFCQALNMPTYPLTTATIALFLFAKCSHENKHYHSNLNYLRRLREACASLWKDRDDFDVENTEELESGLREFQKERRTKTTAQRSSDLNFSQGECSIGPDQSGDGSSTILPQGTWRRARGGTKRGYGSAVEGSGATQGDWESEEDDSEEVAIEQLIIPGLPQPGDRFNSKDELLAATYLVLLPIYGLGARSTKSTGHYIECSRAHSAYRTSTEGRCSWRIGFKEDQSTGEMIVTKEGSNLSHNHGPAPRLLEDSNWRPTIKNKLVRQRLGTGKLISKNKRSMNQAASSSSEPSESESESESSSGPEISFKKPRLPSRIAPPITTVASPRASTSSQKPTTAAQNDDRLLHACPRQYPQKQLQYPSSSSVYTPLQSISHQYQSQLQHISASQSQSHNTSSPSTNLPNSFLPQLSSFLRSLHPSLDSLAIPLHSSGIDSLEILHLFSNFESTTLDSYFNLLKERNASQEISNVHVRLLRKKLQEAKLGDWSN